MKKVSVTFVFFFICGVVLAQPDFPSDRKLPDIDSLMQSLFPEDNRLGETRSVTEIRSYPSAKIERKNNDGYSLISYTDYTYKSQNDSIPSIMAEEAYNDDGCLIYSNQYWWNMDNGEWSLWGKQEYYCDALDRDTLYLEYQKHPDNGEMILVFKWSTNYNEFEKKLYDKYYCYNMNVETSMELNRINQYNSTGMLVSFNEYFRDNSEKEWLHVTELKQDYDENDNQILRESYYLDNDNNWIGEEKMEWIYDISGKLTSEIDFDWNNAIGDWKLSRRSDYDYNSKGNISLEMIHIYDINSNNWILNRRIECNTDINGNITSKICLKYDSLLGDWVGSYKNDYTYNSSGEEIEFVQYNWDIRLNDWIPIFKIEMDYNPSSLLAVYIWNADLNDWRGSWKRETLYNDHNDYYFDAYYEWDNLTNNWFIKDGYRAEITYNLSDQLESSINYSWDSVSLSWFPESREEKLYNNKGDIILEVIDNWDIHTSEWILVYKRFYQYRIDFVTDLTETVCDHIKIYPNPSGSYLFVSGLSNPATIDLHTIHGILVFHSRMLNESIDISTLPEGVYIINLRDDNGQIYSGKIIKK